MPLRVVAGCEYAKNGRWRQRINHNPLGPAPTSGIAGWRPAQQRISVHDPGIIVDCDAGAIGQPLDKRAMAAFGTPVESLGMQDPIHFGGAWGSGSLERALPAVGKILGVAPAALEAWAVTGGQCCHLVEEKQLGVSPVPHLTS